MRRNKSKTITRTEPDLNIVESTADNISHWPETPTPTTAPESGAALVLRHSARSHTRQQAASVKMPPESAANLAAIHATDAPGRQVFGTFTETPIEEIQVLADLGGNGPNRTREINAASGWLKKNGVEESRAEMNFDRSIPGYKAETILYRARGYTFLLVRDFAGKYGYAWPSNN